MAIGPGLYSRFVAVLKVGLPLLAIAMLGSLFLFTEDDGPGGELTFTPAELADLGAGMELLNPVFSGSTDENDTFRFTASVVVPDATPPTRAEAKAVSGRMSLVGGPDVDLTAATADLDLVSRLMRLAGSVEVVTSDGFRLEAERMNVDLRAGTLEADEAVAASGSMGRIDAARLTVRPDPAVRGNRLFLFQGDVRLVYDPAAETE